MIVNIPTYYSTFSDLELHILSADVTPERRERFCSCLQYIARHAGPIGPSRQSPFWSIAPEDMIALIGYHPRFEFLQGGRKHCIWLVSGRSYMIGRHDKAGNWQIVPWSFTDRDNVKDGSFALASDTFGLSAYANNLEFHLITDGKAPPRTTFESNIVRKLRRLLKSDVLAIIAAIETVDLPAYRPVAGGLPYDGRSAYPWFMDGQRYPSQHTEALIQAFGTYALTNILVNGLYARCEIIGGFLQPDGSFVSPKFILRGVGSSPIESQKLTNINTRIAELYTMGTFPIPIDEAVVGLKSSDGGSRSIIKRTINRDEITAHALLDSISLMAEFDLV